MWKSVVVRAGLTSLVLAAPAQAHHSFSMFDQEKVVVIEGTATAFEFINPHSWLYVEAEDAGGRTVEWTIEMGGPGAMSRAGWRADTVKPGDPIVVEVHPLKDGTYGGQYLNARLPDGTAIAGGDSGLPPEAR